MRYYNTVEVIDIWY